MTQFDLIAYLAFGIACVIAPIWSAIRNLRRRVEELEAKQ